MGFLDLDRLKKWREVQPRDVALATEDPVQVDQEFADLVHMSIGRFTSASDVLDFVEAHPDDFIRIMRVGRLRFLAWFLAQPYNDRRDFIDALNSAKAVDGGEGEGSTDGSEGGLERVMPYFYSDLLAFAEAIGPRVAAQIVDSQTLDAVSGAALEVTTKLEMKGQM